MAIMEHEEINNHALVQAHAELEAEHISRWETTRSALSVLAIQAVGFFKVPTALAVSSNAYVYEHLHTPGFSEIGGVAAAAAVSGGWSWFGARVVNGNIDRSKLRWVMPRALTNDLPGLSPETEETGTRAKQVGVSFMRGFTMQGPGTFAYITTASKQEQTKEERLELCRKLGRSGALFMGTLATASTVVVDCVAHGNDEVTHSIFSSFERPPMALAAAWGLTIGTFAYNRIKDMVVRRREERSDQLKAAIPELLPASQES
jgi:hypothetical protein